MAANPFGATTSASDVADAFARQIEGRTVLITGPSLGGIGAEAARVVAHHLGPNGRLVLAGRNISNLEKAKEMILQDAGSAALESEDTISLLVLDLSDRASVLHAAEQVINAGWKIDVLINNAAIMFGPYVGLSSWLHPPQEAQFATNHLGHFLFTNLLIRDGALGKDGRIVNVSSGGHKMSSVRFDDVGFEAGKAYDKQLAYGQAKTANMLFSVELAARGYQAWSIHPGMIQTNLSRSTTARDILGLMWKGPLFFLGLAVGYHKFKTVPQGAATTIVAAFDPDLVGNGGYLVDCKLAPEEAEAYAKDPDNAKRLWALSNELAEIQF